MNKTFASIVIIAVAAAILVTFVPVTRVIVLTFSISTNPAYDSQTLQEPIVKLINGSYDRQSLLEPLFIGLIEGNANIILVRSPTLNGSCSLTIDIRYGNPLSSAIASRTFHNTTYGVYELILSAYFVSEQANAQYWIGVHLSGQNIKSVDMYFIVNIRTNANDLSQTSIPMAIVTWLVKRFRSFSN